MPVWCRARWSTAVAIVLLAGSAGVLVGAVVAHIGARRTEEGRNALVEEQAALRRVATLIAHEATPDEVFAAVVDELRTVLHAEAATICRYEADDTFTITASDIVPVGTRTSLADSTVTSRIYHTQRPARIQYTTDYAEGPFATDIHRLGVRCVVGAPIVVEGRLWGAAAISSTDPEPLPADTEARIASFTELVAIALANAQSRAELTASRARLVTAADKARRRIERDLHDGAQQRLVTLALELDAMASELPPDREQLRAELANTRQRLTGALDELRELSHGIHPAVLTAGGLRPALLTLARRCPLPVTVKTSIAGRLPEPVEVAAYHVAGEALTSAVKYANATTATIQAEHTSNVLILTIHDDGIGGADPDQGLGLSGLVDRVKALGGTITVHSLPRRGRTLTASLPTDSDRHRYPM